MTPRVIEWYIDISSKSRRGKKPGIPRVYIRKFSERAQKKVGLAQV